MYLTKTCKFCGNVQNGIEDWRTCWPCHACSRLNDICVAEADELAEKYKIVPELEEDILFMTGEDYIEV